MARAGYRRPEPNNITVFDAPAAYPQYTPNYYAVFFVDPDGMKLEYGYY